MTKKPLLVDGNNLFAIGYHGAKDYYHNNNHVGGIFHFINTLRLFLVENNHDRVVVFWDGKDSANSRKEVFPKYKENRGKKPDYFDEQSYEYQKLRVMQYLEECFIRQCLVENVEADDMISYYCSISKEEKITIFSGDRDLSQLISENVSLYLPDKKRYIKNNDTINFKELNVHHKNILIYKILVGDKSDNISGIKGFGDKTFLKVCPNVDKIEYSLEDVFLNSKKILEQKNEKSIINLIEGNNDSGIEPKQFYDIVKRIVDLKNPIITEQAKKEVLCVYEESIDPTDRGYKNLIRLMNEDGFFKFLPKIDNNWVDYIRPFTKLIRKEKRF